MQGCLKKASTNNNNDRKGEASCLGTSKLLLIVEDLHVVEDTRDLHVAVDGIGDLLLLDSKAPTSDCSNRSGIQKTKEEIKQG